MKENFVSKSQALELKELGFDEECFGAYSIESHYNDLLFRATSSSSVSYNPRTYKKYSHQNRHIVKAPLYDQAIEWLSEKADKFFLIVPQYSDSENARWTTIWAEHEKRWNWNMKAIIGISDTRQEAKSSVVDHLIKLINSSK